MQPLSNGALEVLMAVAHAFLLSRSRERIGCYVVLLTRFRVSNYKSFRQSEELSFGPGFNVLVGQNNSGKSALLEALRLEVGPHPHRSTSAVPVVGGHPLQRCEVSFTFRIDRSELHRLFPTHLRELWLFAGASTSAPEAAQELAKVTSADFLDFNCSWSYGTPHAGFRHATLPSYSRNAFSPGSDANFHLFRWNEERQEYQFISPWRINASEVNEIGRILAPEFSNRIYSFKAERLNVGRSAFGGNDVLASDASNLPEVLNRLQGNHARFDRYNRLVRRVFPTVERISVHPFEGNTLQILVWTHDVATEREDLAIPLSASGTGIGQALAILYVAMTADYSRVILIDEPNSFLHPSAAKELLSILRETPKHQYLISTHSSEVVAHADPEAIYLLRKDGAETRMQSVSRTDARQLRSMLQELGVSFSDVFGAAHVLWVEGRTEELAIPLIIDHFRIQRPHALAVIGVLHTGDFETKDPDRILTIYRWLSASTALLPPAVGFLFDREQRTESQVADLFRQSAGSVSFLPRRTFENYLLNPAVLRSFAARHSELVIPDDSTVIGFLDDEGSQAPFCTSRRSDNFDDWSRSVDAARLLDRFVEKFSGGKLQFRKTEHSVELTELTLASCPQEFDELHELLKKKLQR
jgi:predicted ATPase